MVVAATAAPVCPALTIGVGVAFLDQVHRTTDGRILFPAHGIDGAVVHFDHLGGMHDFDPAVVAAELFQLRFDAWRCRRRERVCEMWEYSRRAMTAPPTILGGPKSPPMASSAIFIGAEFCGFRARMQNESGILELDPGSRCSQERAMAGHQAPPHYFASTVKTCRPL